jgi:glycerol kinase
LIKKASDSEKMALRVPDTAGVYLVPAFVGLGAPYWDPYARGTLVGLTRATTREHVVRAGLEAMAYQTADVLRLMQSECASPIRALRVDGGASANNFLLQFQADILGTELVRPRCIETTALGAATLAGLSVGVYSDTEEIRRAWRSDKQFTPNMTDSERDVRLAGWHKAVGRSLGWSER